VLRGGVIADVTCAGAGILHADHVGHGGQKRWCVRQVGHVLDVLDPGISSGWLPASDQVDLGEMRRSMSRQSLSKLADG
jgi:hypothetical protein